MTGTTETGLDRIIDLIFADEGLAARAPIEDIEAGAAAADAMNGIIIEGVRALGVANDGTFSAGDIRDLADWIIENRAADFILAHGNDEDDVETGFHLVQGDGGVIKVFGQSAINTVSDGIFHLVFGHQGGNLLNEDGDRNARLESVAWWMNELLSEELEQASNGTGPIRSDVDPKSVRAAETGLDHLIDIALADPGLAREISTSDLQEGAQAAASLNDMITGIIRGQGLANDGKITASDVIQINQTIRGDADLYADFIALHGNDEDGVETGFHLIQGDGANTGLFNRNAINSVADGIYHIGFEIDRGRFTNEDGDKNESVTTVAAWMDLLLSGDLADGSLANTAVSPLSTGSTQTGLDQIIDIISADVGLENRISTGDIDGGIDAANTINQLILDAIEELALANDGRISTADVRDINAWIQMDEARYASFVTAHGNDEGEVETGFHLVQGDGAQSRLFGENAVNTISDAIYHIGFDIVKGRFQNEDGDANQSAAKVASWINALLSEDDFARLANSEASATVLGDTGTGLDALIDIINADPGLEERISTSEIAQGARAANGINAMIIDGLRAVGAAADGRITDIDVIRLNTWVREDDARLAEFIELHGDDEEDVETGFHIVQGDGVRTELFDRNAVDTVMDGLYHTGFEIVKGRFQNEDGDANASVSTVADWLDALLRDDVDSGALTNPALDPDQVDTAALAADHLAFAGPDVSGDGEAGYVILPNDGALALAAATLTMTFEVNNIERGMKALFSKDGRGLQDGGHLTIWVDGKHLRARIQTDEDDVSINVWNVLEAGQEYALGFSFDGGTAQLYLDGELQGAAETTANWLQNDEEIAIGANIWGRHDRRPDWVSNVFDGEIRDVQIFDTALSETEIIAVVGTGAADAPKLSVEQDLSDVVGTTGTGLDQLVEVIVNDLGLRAKISVEEISAGAIAADGMNASIVAGIHATGVGNDGVISAGDVRLLSDWIIENRSESFIEQHGNDEDGVETGFHLVQGDGGATRLYGEAAVNTVADGIYHLVFGYKGDNITNEDGDRNQQLEKLAYWLNSLTASELEAAMGGSGPFYNANVDPFVEPSTGTGLDLVHDIIGTDAGLARKVNTADMQTAADAAHDINQLILDAIAEGGLLNDGDLTASDVRDIAAYVSADAGRYAEFVQTHGNDEEGVETGYHLVQNDGAVTQLYGSNAINTIFDGIYHIGFEIVKGRFRNEDGNANASVGEVAFWLNELLKDDIASGALETDAPQLTGTTGTGLDRLVDIVLDDPGLAARISESDIRAGAEAADAMANLIVEAIVETGVAMNGEIKASDIYDISAWLRADAARFETFKAAHGNDEDDTETGFHLVQGDGASTRLFDQNAVNTVADGLFHIGFEIVKGRLANEDGDANASTITAAGWLDTLLRDEDFVALSVDAGANPYVVGTTGTGLDQLVSIITEDDGLANRISTGDMRDGALAADALNHMIRDAIIELGLANDGILSDFDVRAINALIQNDATLHAEFVELHGNDEDGVETGYHLVQGDGGATKLFGQNAINTIGDGLYHIGFDIQNGRFVNEDGNKNASVSSVAEWLSQLLSDDLAAGTLRNEALSAEAVDPASLDVSRIFELDAPIAVDKVNGAQEFADSADWDIGQGTILFGFTADTPEDSAKDAIFSRDASGNQDGGHVTAYVSKDDLVIRFQDTENSVFLKANNMIEAGQSYDGAFTFDGTQAQLYLDGQLIDLEQTTATWENADEALVIGGSLMFRKDGQTRTDDLFDGEIDTFEIHDDVLTQAEIIASFDDGMFGV